MKRKRIISAMLLMTMIVTLFNTNVFAGGEFSAITCNCEGIFKDCCVPKQKEDKSNQDKKILYDKISQGEIDCKELNEHNSLSTVTLPPQIVTITPPNYTNKNEISPSSKSAASQASSIDVSKLKDNIEAELEGKLKAEIKDEMVNLIYPVGSIFMSTENKNPSTYLGGTWVAWGSGRVPVGVNTSNSNFSTVEKTGGEETVKLRGDQIPPEFATVYWREKGQNGATYNADTSGWAVACAHHNGRQYDKGINNLQPYITCYMWKRTV